MHYFDNVVLKKEKLKETTTGKILKLIGIINLITKFAFCKRRDLWTNTSQFRYVSAPALKKTEMARKRFDLLWQWVVWSDFLQVSCGRTYRQHIR